MPTDRRIDSLKRDYSPLIGKKFGYLTLLEIIPLRIKSSKRRSQVGLFKCDCENPPKEIEITRVVNGETESCCGFKNRLYVGELSGGFFSKIIWGAKNRGLDFLISKEYAWNLFLKQNRKCALSGVELIFKKKSRDTKESQTASLDRIDSSKGYIEGNVQWIHKDINQMKMEFSQDYFLHLIEEIYKYKKGI